MAQRDIMTISKADENVYQFSFADEDGRARIVKFEADDIEDAKRVIRSLKNLSEDE